MTGLLPSGRGTGHTRSSCCCDLWRTGCVCTVLVEIMSSAHVCWLTLRGLVLKKYPLLLLRLINSWMATRLEITPSLKLYFFSHPINIRPTSSPVADWTAARVVFWSPWCNTTLLLRNAHCALYIYWKSPCTPSCQNSTLIPISPRFSVPLRPLVSLLIGHGIAQSISSQALPYNGGLRGQGISVRFDYSCYIACLHRLVLCWEEGWRTPAVYD